MNGFKLEEVLKMLREDKTLEFDITIEGIKTGRIYIEEEVLLCNNNPFVTSEFTLDAEYYLIEKGIKFKDMEEGKNIRYINNQME